jgi:hypothetical protein
VAFHPDGKSILIGSYSGRTSVWTVPAPLPPEMTPDQVVLWAQVRMGLKLDATGLSASSGLPVPVASSISRSTAWDKRIFPWGGIDPSRRFRPS